MMVRLVRLINVTLAILTRDTSLKNITRLIYNERARCQQWVHDIMDEERPLTYKKSIVKGRCADFFPGYGIDWAIYYLEIFEARKDLE